MAIEEAVRTEGFTLAQAAIEGLKARLRGPLITPEDAEYASARRVYNGMIDRYPRLIARCRDVADVISTVTSAVRPDSRSRCAGVATTGLAWAPATTVSSSTYR